MSKHFELMQVTGIDVNQEAADSSTGFSSVNGGRGTDSRQGTLDLDRLAHEESLKLVQRIFLVKAPDRPRAVVFAAVDSGNGCSRICAHAAQILAHNVSGSVCLVEANFRSPSLPQFFDVPNHRGLTDSLLLDGPVQSFAKRLRPDNLWLLSAGSLVADSINLLHSDTLKRRLGELREQFDYLLIDVPALNRYADATALARIADGLVLVLEANSTRRESALKGVESLRATQVRLLGAVLNKRTFPIPGFLYRRLW